MKTAPAAAPAAAAPAGVEPPPAAAPRWWIWLAAWPVAAVFVLSNAATPLYTLWQHDIGFSRGTLTIVFASYIAGLIGSLLVAGVASDRVGRKPVLLPALALAAVACLVFATAFSVAALVVARLLSGIAVGAVVSAGMAAVTDVAGAARRRTAALVASSAMVLGAGLGPLLAGVLSENLPAPTATVFLVEIALLAAAFAVVLRMPVPRMVARPVARAAAAPARGAWIRLPRMPHGTGGRLLLGAAAFAPGITGTSFVLSLGPSLLSGLLGTTSRTLAGAMAFVMFLASTGVQFAVRRLRVRTILLAATASTAVSMIGLVGAVRSSSVALLVAAAVMAGAGQGMGQLGGLSLLNSAVPAGRLAEANAALNVSGYLPAGLLPVSAGYLSDAVGLTTGATTFGVVLAALAAAGGLVVLTGRRWAPEA
ncbi:MFS transporter [Streptomyces sp. NPDC053048]|uniref:MFS transporter n=1 Tax=Streptomyces sp. NPDC053048 TaxID=3365694 RepID=UPI0037D47757